MTTTRSHKIRSLGQAWIKGASAGWQLAKAGGGALALFALWLLPGSCRAIDSPLPASLRSNAILPADSGPVQDDGNHRNEIVIIEPEGHTAHGFQFQIVLDSATRGPESSLNLAANAAGLVVTARDVDGVGNDLDLIVKSAYSYIPIGIWINDHHGGFIKADARVYALSIWSANPQLLPLNSTETVFGAMLLWHDSYVQSAAYRFPHEPEIHPGRAGRADYDLLSRLTADPNQERGPPLSVL